MLADTVTINGVISRGNIDEKLDNIDIIIYNIKKIKMTPSSLKLHVSDIYNLLAIITPNNALNDIIWSSSNENIVFVSENDTITCNSIGNAIIYATARYGSAKGKMKVIIK